MLRTCCMRVANRPTPGPPYDSGTPRLCPSPTAISTPSAPGAWIAASASGSAVALTSDSALLTAISNDRDFAKVFADQLRLLARSGDMALALSTSGHSPNLVQGLDVARELGVLTIAFTGKDGGRLATLADHGLELLAFEPPRFRIAIACSGDGSPGAVH
jgi:hypothetical protein